MRVYGDPEKGLPPWLMALLIFAVLVAVVQLVGRTTSQPSPLQQQFAASPPAADAGRIQLPPVPTNLVALARTTTARVLSGISSAPLNSTGRNMVLEVAITNIDPVDGGLRLAGTVTNISTAPATVSLDNFKFTDGSGTVYASTGSPATTLQPQQAAPLDITLPIPTTTQLSLAVEQPGQEPIKLVLLNAPPTPTP